MKRFILTISFCLFSVLGFSQQTKALKQLLVVDIFEYYNTDMKDSGIYINEESKETKFIPFAVGFHEKGNRIKIDTVAKAFRELYADGWSLVTSNGGDNRKRYIFEK